MLDPTEPVWSDKTYFTTAGKAYLGGKEIKDTTMSNTLRPIAVAVGVILGIGASYFFFQTPFQAEIANVIVGYTLATTGISLVLIGFILRSVRKKENIVTPDVIPQKVEPKTVESEGIIKETDSEKVDSGSETEEVQNEETEQKQKDLTFSLEVRHINFEGNENDSIAPFYIKVSVPSEGKREFEVAADARDREGNSIQVKHRGNPLDISTILRNQFTIEESEESAIDYEAIESQDGLDEASRWDGRWIMARLQSKQSFKVRELFEGSYGEMPWGFWQLTPVQEQE